MKTVETLKSLGYEISLRGEKIVYKYQGEEKPSPAMIRPLLEELKARKQEALAYLSAQDAARTAQTKFCSWREMAVPAEECVKPCYRFDPGEVKECKHLLAWWKERVKWLQNNNPEILTPPQHPTILPHLASGGEAFDPDGALASLLECAKRKGIGDAQVVSIVDDLIRAKSLKPPWGIKIKNSPILGDYWVVSDDEAKKLIPGNEAAFTAEDIGLLAEVREIFGIKAIEVKKRE